MSNYPKKNKKIHSVKHSLLYLLCLCILAISMTSLLSQTHAKLGHLSHASDSARLPTFEIRTTSQEVGSDSTNIIDFEHEGQTKIVNFTVENTGETSAHVLTVVLTNASGVSLPNYQFLTETDFYLMSHEARDVQLELASAAANYFTDTLEELHLEIVAEQAD